ncbi:MAG TPA: hypothetical protein VEG44_09630 [Candidatus Acidoferrales bacterium]|nr:hypothetical protein [Candidatus Acidoferrales bacterium]
MGRERSRTIRLLDGSGLRRSRQCSNGQPAARAHHRGVDFVGPVGRMDKASPWRSCLLRSGEDALTPLQLFVVGEPTRYRACLSAGTECSVGTPNSISWPDRRFLAAEICHKHAKQRSG